MKKAFYRLLALAVVGAAGWGLYRYITQLPARQQTIPTATVQRGDVVIRAFTRGELHAVRSVTLVAPNLNGIVQVTRLAPAGALAQKGDLVVEYDDSERQMSLDTYRLTLESIDQQIREAKSSWAMQQSQDGVTLLQTRYNVRRAQLDVQKNPILDAIDAKKNILALDQSKRALVQLESDIQARKAQADSQIAVMQEQRNRALIAVEREQQRIAQTKTLAPITGLVSIRQNRAGFFNFGQDLPDVHEGDTLYPGMMVADILDLSELEVWTKVGELDRANLRDGQDALIRLDAIPNKQFHGKISAMSATASVDVFSGDPAKKFDVIFSIDMRQLLSELGMKPADIERIMATAKANANQSAASTAPSFLDRLAASRKDKNSPANPLALLQSIGSGGQFTDADRAKAQLPLPPEQDSRIQTLLRPGLLADVEIVVEKIPNAVHVPAQAVFNKGGRYLVYVRQKDGRFDSREVKLKTQSESAIVISSGVQPGEVIALADPTASPKKGKSQKKAQDNPMGSMPGGKQ